MSSENPHELTESDLKLSMTSNASHKKVGLVKCSGSDPSPLSDVGCRESQGSWFVSLISPSQIDFSETHPPGKLERNSPRNVGPGNLVMNMHQPTPLSWDTLEEKGILSGT